MLSYTSAPEKKHLDPSQILLLLQGRINQRRSPDKAQFKCAFQPGSSASVPNLLRAGIMPWGQRNCLPFTAPQKQEAEQQRARGCKCRAQKLQQKIKECVARGSWNTKLLENGALTRSHTPCEPWAHLQCQGLSACDGLVL